jgi:FKBP-type peptidyl-prolyl cis-trans isomerase FkpA
MRTRFFVLLIAALGVAACAEQAQDEQLASESTSNTASDSATQPTHAAESAMTHCPPVDDGGHVDIAPGLRASILTKGEGRIAVIGDYVDVHTTLWLHDATAEGGRGLEIWSSGGVEPFGFPLGRGRVIKGWDMGVPCMQVGETRELIIVGDLAYGPGGRGEIPPNATLLFNIELVKLTAPEG